MRCHESRRVVIARRELSRKGFLAGSLPLLASVPFARNFLAGDAQAQTIPDGEHAERMERVMEDGAHGGGTIGEQVIADVAQKQIPEVWFNPGAESDALVARARSLNIRPVEACSIVGIGQNPYAL